MRVEQYENATLYCGDYREVFDALPMVQAAVTDPPYGIRYETRRKKFTERPGAIENDEAAPLWCVPLIAGKKERSRRPPNAAGHKRTPDARQKRRGQPPGKGRLLYQYSSNTSTAKKQEPEKQKQRRFITMKRLKRRIFSGTVCEQIVFSAPDRLKNLDNTEPRPRFKVETEREERKLGISRRKHVKIVNNNFGPSSLYGTLTMDNENEVHTFQEARQLRDKFYNRIKYHCPEARIMIYMGRGKNTHRIHFHFLMDGVPEDVIRKQWNAGTVLRIDNLREHNCYDGADRGWDYTSLANYLFNHWTPEQGGHRWKGSRKTLKEPEYEEPTEVKRSYTEDKPPRPPKCYIFVEAKSTKYGYLYYKYMLKPPKKTRQKTKKEQAAPPGVSIAL